MDFQLTMQPPDGNVAATGKLRVIATITGSTRVPECLWTFRSTEQPALAPLLQVGVPDSRGRYRASMDVVLPKPGFQQVCCRIDGIEHQVRAYRQPENVTVALTREPDFDTFWRGTLAALKRVPVRPTIRQTSVAHGIRTSEITLTSLGGVTVRGWLEEPLKPGRYPAVLRVPGYGGSMEPLGMFTDRVVFSFNPRGHGNSQEQIKGKPEDFWIRGLDDKDGYFYQGCYMDCIRAIDFLLQHASVDASRIAVWGGSQGGGLAFATAALSQQISLCIADIPFLCDWKNYFALSDWPEMESWICAKTDRSWEKTLRTLSYFDTMNLADRVRCPVFMGIGLQDDICPPSTSFAAFNRVRGPRDFIIYPMHGHGVPDSHYAAGWKRIEKRFGLLG